MIPRGVALAIAERTDTCFLDLTLPFTVKRLISFLGISRCVLLS